MAQENMIKTIKLVADRLYTLGGNNKHSSTTSVIEPLGEELQRLSFMLEKSIQSYSRKQENDKWCTNCGNIKCSMQAGVCAKWEPIRDSVQQQI